MFITLEAFQGTPCLAWRRYLQGTRTFAQRPPLTTARGGAGGSGRGTGTGENVHDRVDQRQQHRLHLGQAMADITAQEGRNGQVGAVPGVIQGDGRTDEGQHAQGHFQVVEHGAGLQSDLLQIQRIIGARCCPMGFQQTAHVHIQQMRRQGCAGWPGRADADQPVEVFQPGLVDPADVVGDIALQGTVGQVADHRAAQAIVEQAQPRLLKAVELAQKNPVGTVGQIKQGQTTDLLHDKGDAGQRGRPLPMGVLAAHREVCRQQFDAFAIGAKAFTAVGIDGDVQDLLAIGIDVFGEHGELALQTQHQAPGFTQAFVPVFIVERRCRRGAEKGLADQRFIFPGHIQLGDQLAQPGRSDAAFHFLPLYGVGTADLDLHQRQSPPHFLIDVAQRQVAERQLAALLAGDQYILLGGAWRGAFHDDFAPSGGIGNVEQHLHLLSEVEVLA
ncbi:hypothetical protein D3C81_665500 [compost metagenome]